MRLLLGFRWFWLRDCFHRRNCHGSWFRLRRRRWGRLRRVHTLRCDGYEQNKQNGNEIGVADQPALPLAAMLGFQIFGLELMLHAPEWLRRESARRAAACTR